jgi:hypothetical protein
MKRFLTFSLCDVMDFVMVLRDETRCNNDTPQTEVCEGSRRPQATDPWLVEARRELLRPTAS